MQLLAAAIGGIVVLGLIITSTFSIPYALLIILLMIVFAVYGVLMQTARGLGRPKVFAAASLVSAVTTLVTAFIFVVRNDIGVTGVLLSVIAANAVAIVYLVFATKLWQYIQTGQSSNEIKKSLLAYSLPLVPNNAALWIVNSADRTIIVTLLDVSANGIYAVAVRFPFALMGLFGVYTMSWTEAVSMHIHSKDKDRDEFLSDAFNTGLKLIASCGLLLVAGMHFVFPLFINEQFSEAYLYIPILTLGVILSAAMSMYGAVYIAKKMTKKVAVTSLYAAGLNVALSLILVPFMGLYGAAIASVLGFGAVAVIRHFDVRKYLRIRYDVRSYVLLFSSYALVCVLYYSAGTLNDIVASSIAIATVLYSNKKEIMQGRRLMRKK
jgi:O-antigen/teichoic acid export membrane protein